MGQLQQDGTASQLLVKCSRKTMACFDFADLPAPIWSDVKGRPVKGTFDQDEPIAHTSGYRLRVSFFPTAKNS